MCVMTCQRTSWLRCFGRPVCALPSVTPPNQQTTAAAQRKPTAFAGPVRHRYHVIRSSANAKISTGTTDRQAPADIIAIRQKRTVVLIQPVSTEFQAGGSKKCSGTELPQKPYSGE